MFYFVLYFMKIFVYKTKLHSKQWWKFFLVSAFQVSAAFSTRLHEESQINDSPRYLWDGWSEYWRRIWWLYRFVFPKFSNSISQELFSNGSFLHCLGVFEPSAILYYNNCFPMTHFFTVQVSSSLQ